MIVSDPVRQWAEATPDALALTTGAETWTWADLDLRVGGAAARIAGGEGPLAVRADTSPDLVVLVLAALRAGRLLVPLSTRWAPAAVVDALRRLGIDRLLADDPVDGVDSAPLAEVLGEPERGVAPPLPLDRPFTVVHTSGSTARPKAIVHSVGNHVWSARGVVERLGFGADGRWLLDLPLYHVGGLGVVMRAAVTGGALALPSPGLGLARAIRQLAPTHASLVATQLRRLLDAGAALSGLDAILLGGSAIPPDLLDRAEAHGLQVSVSYGCTEMTSTVTATVPGADRAALATAGERLPYRELRIADTGEIEVSGPTRYLGMLGPDGIEPAPDWHPTGDLGHLDAVGRLVVTGRRDLQFVLVVTGRRDLQFVSGGENVQPEAIEAALLALDAVAEAVVLPVPDPEFGSRPVAFVRTAARAGIDPAALADALRQSLPGFMIPIAFLEWRGAEGMKPDRLALADRARRWREQAEERLR